MNKIKKILYYSLTAVLPLLYGVWVKRVTTSVKEVVTKNFHLSPGLALLLLATFAAYGLLVAGAVFCARDYLHAKSYRVLLWICAGVSLVLSADYYITHTVLSVMLVAGPLFPMIEVLPYFLGAYAFLLGAAYHRSKKNKTQEQANP